MTTYTIPVVSWNKIANILGNNNSVCYRTFSSISSLQLKVIQVRWHPWWYTHCYITTGASKISLPTLLANFRCKWVANPDVNIVRCCNDHYMTSDVYMCMIVTNHAKALQYTNCARCLYIRLQIPDMIHINPLWIYHIICDLDVGGQNRRCTLVTCSLCYIVH